MTTRRDFLKTASLLGFGATVPAFLARTAQAAAPGKDTILVVVEMTGGNEDLQSYVIKRAARSIDAGCDGIIASGDAIGWCRAAFPAPTLIVSPGIRPAGASADDQKRHTTPADAIRLGADYLVVGRPILRAAKPRDAAARVIAEIEEATSALRHS